MRIGPRQLLARVSGLSAVAFFIALSGCALSTDIPRQPSVGDSTVPLLEQSRDPFASQDARLRRQGLSATRDGRRVTGYQVYFHGRNPAPGPFISD